MITVLIFVAIFVFIYSEVLVDLFWYKSWTIPLKAKKFGALHHSMQLFLFAEIGFACLIYGRYYAYLSWKVLIIQTLLILSNYITFRIFFFNTTYDTLRGDTTRSDTAFWDRFLTWYNKLMDRIFIKIFKSNTLEFVTVFSMLLGLGLMFLTSCLMIDYMKK
jgi:hypothetical protein